MRIFVKSFLFLGFLSMASAQFAPNNLDDLKTAVNLCIEESEDGLCPILANTTIGTGAYGAIGDWDVSKVTSLDLVFYYNKRYFNQSIGDWDTSSVTSLLGTFYGAEAFNQPIGDWNTSSVTTLSHTFGEAGAFNQPIGDWDTSKVTTLEKTFYKASVFNQPIGDWNTSSVTSLHSTFDRAYVFNQPIGDWNVSSVTKLSWTFYGAFAFNQDLSTWVTTVDTGDTFVFSGMCTAIRGGACNCAGDMRVDGVCPNVRPDVCGVPAGDSLCLDKNGGTLISKDDCDNCVTVPTPSPETSDPETSIPVWLIVGLVLSLVLNVVVSVLYAVMICNKKALGASSTPRALYTKLNLYTNEIKF